MSYLALSLVLSVILGFVGMFMLVVANAPHDNARRVVYGSIAFWALVAVLAYVTTGWSSALASVVGGFLVFLLAPSTLGNVLFTWGRALIGIANYSLWRNSIFVRPLRALGCACKDVQASLSKLHW